MRFVLALAGALLLTPQAQAQTRADCDRIENPMLFNRCLASLTPERQPRARSVGGGDRRSFRRGAVQAERKADPVKSIGGGRKRLELPMR